MSGYYTDWTEVEREAADLLSRYLQVDTTNPPGGETEGARFLQDVLAQDGIGSDIIESKPGRGNLVTHFEPTEESPAILLLHHIDVVPAEKQRWRHPPFSGRMEGDFIWGRGALDCKFLGIMQLLAFVLLKREGLHPERCFRLAATADEEAGGTWGVKWLMENRPDTLKALAVVNEGVGWAFPTTGRSLCLIQVAEKAACWMGIRFEGEPGHGSLPHGRNCMAGLGRALDALFSHRFPIRVTDTVSQLLQGIAPLQGFMPQERFLDLLRADAAQGVLDSLPDETVRTMLTAVLRNTAVPTCAQAGTKTNVIPGECSCDVDCRLLPGSTPDELRRAVQELLTASGCGSFSIDFADPGPATASPVDTPAFSALRQGFQAIDPNAAVLPYMSPGATDSRFFRQKNIPAYGVQIDATLDSVRTIHGHNERIRRDRLLQGVRALYTALRSLL